MSFSVLMSIYHKEKPEFLQDCLDSIINQTVIPNEIVIVKDGPLTIQLDNVLNAYISKNESMYKIVQLKDNVGLGKALAIGVESCSFNLIARMDTDDISRVDRFENQLREFINNETLDIVGSHILEFEKDLDNILAKRKVPLLHDEIYKYAKKRNPFNHMTVMYKKEAVIKSGNYRLVHGVGYEDYDLWVRMLMCKCKGKNIDDVLVYARSGAEMYKRRGNKERLKTALYFRRKQYETGFTSFSDLLISSVSNIIVSLLPNKLRGIIYRKFLRR